MTGSRTKHAKRHRAPRDMAIMATPYGSLQGQDWRVWRATILNLIKIPAFITVLQCNIKRWMHQGIMKLLNYYSLISNIQFSQSSSWFLFIGFTETLCLHNQIFIIILQVTNIKLNELLKEFCVATLIPSFLIFVLVERLGNLETRQGYKLNFEAY